MPVLEDGSVMLSDHTLSQSIGNTELSSSPTQLHCNDHVDGGERVCFED